VPKGVGHVNMTHHPGLLEVVRQRIRLKHYSHRTETPYVHWVWRFVVFHEVTPAGTGVQEPQPVASLASTATPSEGEKHSR
jgi:hypothetical protein